MYLNFIYSTILNENNFIAWQASSLLDQPVCMTLCPLWRPPHMGPPNLVRASWHSFPEYSERRASGPGRRLETCGVSPSYGVMPRFVVGKQRCGSVLVVVFPPTVLESSVAVQHSDPTRSLLCGMLASIYRRNDDLHLIC